MSKTPLRRTVLSAGTAMAATAVAGCLLNNQEAQGNLFVENTKGTEQVVQIIVSPGESITDDRVVDAWYRVPEGIALESQGALEAGQTYTIGVRAADEPPSEDIGITVDPCEEDSEGRRDVSVRIRDDGHGVIPWSCGEDYTERELEYEDPENHRVEAPGDVGTWTSPTPGASDDTQNGSS